jgi:hypothetical protein
MPAVEQQRDLLLAADKRRQECGADCREPALRRAFAKDLDQRHRLGDALEHPRPEIATAEPVAGKAPGRRRDDNPAGRCFGLQPCREIGSLADDGAGLAAADLADDDEAGGDPDAGAKRRPMPVETGHRPGQLEPRPHRPFGVVLMGVRKPEIGEHAVAEILRQKTVEAPHHPGGTAMVGPDHLTQFLGVEARRQRRRIGEVAKEDRQLASLGFGARGG